MSHTTGTSDMGQLVGGTIVAIIADEGGQAHGFRVRVKPNGISLGITFDCFVQSDDEGNDIGTVVVVPRGR